MIVTGNASVGGSYVGTHVPLPTAPIRRAGDDIVTRVEARKAWKSPIVLTEPTAASRAASAALHGTMKGVWRHRAAGEKICAKCRAANTAYQREYRQKKAQAGGAATTNRDPGTYQQPRFDVDAAATDFRTGLTVRELCEKYGVSKTVMRRQLSQRHGLRAERVTVDRDRVQELNAQGLTSRQIATELDCSYSAVYKILADLQVPMVRATVSHDTIREAYAKRPSIQAVAKELHVSRETVRVALGIRQPEPQDVAA